MPHDYAKRLAARLIEDHEDKVVVDVPNDGFSDEVAAELVRLGFFVKRDDFKPHRFTIVRPPTSESA